MSKKDQFSVRKQLNVGGQSYNYYSLQAFEAQGNGHVQNLPFSIKVLLEAAIRQFDGKAITAEHVKQIAGWASDRDANKEIPFIPARIVLQDFTGVPVVVDLAAMRDTMKRAGGDPKNGSTRLFRSTSLSTTRLWLMLSVPRTHSNITNASNSSATKSATLPALGANGV